MSGVWVQIIEFLVSLSLLIVLHEGGHFICAKLFKTKVEKFYLFFDFLFPFSNILPFSLFKKKVGDTTYGIGWFPLGGYVKIAGMVDESMDKDQMEKPPEPWEFRSKPAWQRLIIMLGGIIVNILLAFIIYAGVLFTWGQQRLPMSEVSNGVLVTDSLAYDLGFRDGDKIEAVNHEPVTYYNQLMPKLLYANTVRINRNGKDTVLTMPVNFIGQLVDNKNKQLFALPYPAIVGKVLKGSGAAKSGLKEKDKIVAVNGVKTPNFKAVKQQIEAEKGQEINISIIRENQTLSLMGQVSDTGTLGFAFALPRGAEQMAKIGGYHLKTINYGFFEAIPAGIKMGINKLKFYVDQFKLILNPSTGAYKGLGGFISIGKIYPKTWNWQAFWLVTAFISIILAFMNLLPIPGLDGGYVLFTLIEMITGRKINEKIFEVITVAGLIILAVLMIYANGMDVVRLFQ